MSGLHPVKVRFQRNKYLQHSGTKGAGPTCDCSVPQEHSSDNLQPPPVSRPAARSVRDHRGNLSLGRIAILDLASIQTTDKAALPLYICNQLWNDKLSPSFVYVKQTKHRKSGIPDITILVILECLVLLRCLKF